jgi:hypothetical protein
MGRKKEKPTGADSAEHGPLSPVDELIQRGLAAIGEYDYEAARTALTRAFELSGGDESAARALLVLLVDHLAAYQDALELGDRLPRAVLAVPAVQLVLGLAAARSGAPQRARAHVARLDGAAAAEVLAVLAEAALAAGELNAAAGLCDEIRSKDRSHPSVQPLARRLAQAREDLRRPGEAAIEQAIAEGRSEDAARLAERLLASFPESAPARRAVQAAREQMFADKAERLVRAAEEALACGDLGVLPSRLHAARTAAAAAPADQALALRLTTLESALAARELDARVRDAQARLADADPRSGLTHYVSLTPDVRRRVREVAGLPILDDLERLLERRADRVDVVAAALALGEAAAIADSDPEGALQRLAPHERTLVGLGTATRLTARLRQRLRDERRRKLSDLLAAARATLDTGDAAAALELLGKGASRELEPGDRETVEALRAEAKASLETHELAASYERLLTAGNPLEAREVAEQLLARAGPAEQDRRRDQVAAAKAAARRAFGVWTSQVDDDRAEGREASPSTVDLIAPMNTTTDTRSSASWLDAAGRSLVLLECHDHWAFMQVIDLAARRVRSCAVFRTPEQFDDLRAALSPDGVLTMASRRGVLQISAETWEPLAWCSSRTFGSNGIFESFVVTPDGRFLWAQSLRVLGDTGWPRVVDLARRRVVRELSDGQRFWPLPGAGEPTMALSRRETTLSLHHPNGMLMDGGRIELPTSVWHAVIHPSGEGWLAFLSEGGILSKDSLRLGFVEIDATGRASTPTWLAGWSPGRSCSFATSLAQRMSFVVTRKNDQSVSIQALRAAPSLPVSQVYRASVPAGIQMALDPGSRHVLALVPDHERVHVAPLGQEPPDFPLCETVHDYLHVPGFDMGCTYNVVFDAEGQATVRQLQASPERSTTVWMERQIAASGGDIVELLKIHTVLMCANRPSAREDFLRWLQSNRPSDPHLAVLRAEEHAQAQRWDEVRSSLEGVELGVLLPVYRRHAHHILGLALLRTGDLARALDVLEVGHSTTTGHCRLDELLAVLRPLRDDGDPSSPLGRLRAAIHEADAGLLCDDLPSARAAIDRRIVWQSGEVQSLARLAEVELRAEPDRAAGRFRKALALARFLDAHRTSTSRKDLPVPGTAWAAPRIAELEQRAQAWLDRLGAPEATPDEVSPPVVDGPPVALPSAWQLALREFDAVMSGESPRVPARLAFRVRHSGRRFEAIEVLLQRQLRNGRFSPGQLTDASEILGAAVALGEDADAPAVVVLTEGIPQMPRSRVAPSRARMLRLLATLVGHPRIFLADRPAEPVSVRQACMGLEFVDATGGLVPRFVLGGARWTADELLAHVDLSVVVDVDAQAGSVTLAPLDAAVLALVEAFQRHQPAFPEESHRELRRRLGALQHAVELLLPDELAGEVRGADSRPVVRLTPEGDAGLLVEIGVRPVPEAVFGHPGEGSRLALGAVDGVHVSARRDLARERASAERVAALPAFAGATRERRWCYRTSGEAQSLAVVEALTELGDEVVVEWPRGVRAWRWVGRATPGDLRVRISRGNDLLRIEGGVEIDDHRVALAALLEAVVHGRRYVAIGPQEFLGLAADLCERLAVAGQLIHTGRGGLEAGVSAAPALADLEADPLSADAAWCSLRERATAAEAFEPILPAGLRADLRPYQFEGFRWLARLSAWAPGACLADDMGLGKTVQALALLVHRAALGPALVIAPISVTPGWISEAARFAPGLRVLPYRGADRDALLVDMRPGDLVVAGYGVVTRDVDALANVRFATLILDEAHAIKNAATRRAQAVGRLQADFRVALTGTPVENHLAELWSLFRVISPGLLGTWPQFRERFVVPIERDQSAERHAALGRVLRPFILRRTKERVLPELPPLIELERLVSLSSAELELYATTRLAAATAIRGARTPKERVDVLSWLTRLRRLACHPRMVRKAWTGTSSKLDAFMAVVDELRATGHRALVFSQFTDHLALVREALIARGISTVYLDGDTSLDERARAVESFQRGVGDLFLISLKAGGTGLNLTAADHVIHLDPWWNPAVEDQATDRAHRIGQSRPVTVIRLIAQGTIEEAVLALHADKRDLAERLLAGTDVVARLSAEDLIELVRHGIMTASPVESTDEDEPEASTIPAL